MLRRQGLYTVIGKISLLAYKLDIPVYMKIHPMISIVYFSQYRIHEDPFHRVLPPFGPIEYNSDSDISTDEV